MSTSFSAKTIAHAARSRAGLWAIPVIASLAIAGCSGNEPALVAADSDEAGAAMNAAPAPQAEKAGSIATTSAGGELAPSWIVHPQEPAGAMLIRSGQARVEVDSLEPAIARVQVLAQRVGGYVMNTSVQSGGQRLRTAHLVLRMPSERFDEAVGALRPVGELESLEVSAQDVGEEFVDVSARLENARRLESRLLEILRTRTGKLEEVLAMERELARVREEIERLEGRLRYLQSRVAMSTLAVELHEPAPLVASHPGEHVIVDALQQSWRNFVGVIAGTIAALGVLVPLGLMGGVLAWIALRVRRLAERRRAAPAGS